jgi:predicted nucleotidyltransferase
MDFDLDTWIGEFQKKLKALFGPRIQFVGLQGSYNRGEATDTSDIDMVVILDQVTPADLRAYSALVDTLPNREKACGFIAGKRELLGWDAPDLFQFYYDTRPLLGTLDDLIPTIRKEDVQRAIRLGACNIYHICGHNLVHGKNPGTLRGLYKAASFTIQAVYFDQTGDYVKQKVDLLPLLQPAERAILQTAKDFKAEPEKAAEGFDAYADQLFNWASEVILRYPASD